MGNSYNVVGFPSPEKRYGKSATDFVEYVVIAIYTRTGRLR
jgi:hypothetical protein